MTHDCRAAQGEGQADSPALYQLRLFVAGEGTNSAIARASLNKICENHLKGNCRVEVIDVLKDCRLALQENILVTPALIVQRARTRTVIFGNLTDMDKVLAAMQIGSEEL